MTVTAKRLGMQFSLRSLLGALIWMSLLLAICVHHQHAVVRQREALQSLQGVGLTILKPKSPGPAILPAHTVSQPERAP